MARAISPGQTALALSCLLALVHLGVLVAGAQRARAAASLTEDVDALRTNLSALTQITVRRQAELRQELAAAEARVATLDASLPTLGAPLNIYRRGFEAADESQIELVGIQRKSVETHDTAIGNVRVTTYSLQASGGFEPCLSWIGRMEQTSRTWSLEAINIQPDNSTCSFDVKSVSGIASAVP